MFRLLPWLAVLTACASVIPEGAPDANDDVEDTGDPESPPEVVADYTGPPVVIWAFEGEAGPELALGDPTGEERGRWMHRLALPDDGVHDVVCSGSSLYVLSENLIVRVDPTSGRILWETETRPAAVDVFEGSEHVWSLRSSGAAMLGSSLASGVEEFEYRLAPWAVEDDNAPVGLVPWEGGVLSVWRSGEVEVLGPDGAPTDVARTPLSLGSEVIVTGEGRTAAVVLGDTLHVVSGSGGGAGPGVHSLDLQSGDSEHTPVALESLSSATIAPDGTVWMAVGQGDDKAIRTVALAPDGTLSEVALQGGTNGDWPTSTDIAVDVEGGVWLPLVYSPPDTFGSGIGRFDPEDGTLQETWSDPDGSDCCGVTTRVLTACAPTPEDG